MDVFYESSLESFEELNQPRNETPRSGQSSSYLPSTPTVMVLGDCDVEEDAAAVMSALTSRG